MPESLQAQLTQGIQLSKKQTNAKKGTRISKKSVIIAAQKQLEI